MGTVVVALERGFRDHHVTVAVDGKTVLDATNVTTDPDVGLAGSMAVEAGPRCRVEVSLPEAGTSADLEVTVGELTYLRVALFGQTLVLTPVMEGPRYV